MHVVLARYDDHLSFYRLEQQFRERHGVVIPRPQMVQWAGHIANWLLPVYDAMWQEMLAGGYLQVDETPVKVLDPEVEGKAARGFLWFCAVPGGDVILVFDPSRGQQPVRDGLKDFAGTIQTDAYEFDEALRKRQPGPAVLLIRGDASIPRHGKTLPAPSGSSRRSSGCTRSKTRSGSCHGRSGIASDGKEHRPSGRR